MKNTNAFGFDHAINGMKCGYRFARKGWNGKDMYVYLNRGSFPFGLKIEDGAIHGVWTSLFDVGDTGTVVRMPNFNMKAVDGSTVTGWLASQTDMLAEDWVELP